MSSNFYQIDKLDESNYEVWKIQMRSVLIHGSLWDFVSGKAVKPEKKDAENYAAYVAKDEKALASILLSVKSNQLLHVKSCKTSKEAWDKLIAVYQSKGPARRVSLFKQLVYLRMPEGGTMQQHLNNFFEVSDRIIEADIKLPEDVFTIILLGSLPKEYDNFVIAIESRDELPKMDILKNKLLEESLRREGQSKDTDETAFVMKGTKTNKYQKNNWKKQQQQSDNHQNPRVFNNRKCFNCGKRGHFIAECRFPKRSQDENKSSSAFVMLNMNTNFAASALSNDSWIFDSGATSHMCSDKTLFTSLRQHEENIEVAGENFMKSSGLGEVKITTSYSDITLKDVLYVPEMRGNFVSISKATDSGLLTVFSKSKATIKRYNNEKLLQANRVGGLYILDVKNNQKLFNCGAKSDENFKLWHERFGHLNARSLSEMSKKNLVRGMELKLNLDNLNCEVCLQGKLSALPFKSSTSKSTEILELIHSDLCGPMKVNSLGGSRYFALFIDDYSSRMFVFFLKNKSDVFNCFRNFKAMVENETNKKIKTLRSDNGGEYVNKEFSKFLEENGIHHQLTVAQTPQQNGKSERANRTVVEMARCLLISSGMPDFLWAEAVNTAVYLRNRSSTKSLNNKTPYEAWYNKPPNVKHLKVFGCKAFMLDKSSRRSKFQPKGIECYMVGYSSESKAYRVYQPDQRKIIKVRDIKFLENCMKNGNTKIEFFEPEPEEEERDTESESEEEEEESESLEEEEAIEIESSGDEVFEDAREDKLKKEVKKSPNVREEKAVKEIAVTKEKSMKVKENSPSLEEEESQNPEKQKKVKVKIPVEPRTGLRQRVNSTINFMKNCENFQENPLTLNEALKRQDKSKWTEAMEIELGNLRKNKTWELVKLPENRKALKSKWVFNIKRDKNGDIDKYKARLVAKGCGQKAGIDFQETFSPVVRYSSIRLILALSVEYDFIIHQMDVVSAYLNGDLQDEIYMEQPEGFVDQKHPTKVCKLLKGLYGLKQAGREWNHKLDEILKKIGFVRSRHDPCVYVLKNKSDYVLLAVFVDDIVVSGSSEKIVYQVKQQIALNIEVVDKGPVDYFLGMEINVDKSKKQIQIHQKQFIQNLLENYNMANCRKVSTPLDPGQKFEKCLGCENCKKVNEKSYQSLIGSLLYLSMSTRPDISYAVNKLSQFNTSPHPEHLSAAKHILRYLQSTINLRLTYSKSNKILEGFSDADWAGNFDRKSHTGNVFILANGAIVWETKKQSSVALSSTEAEYMAMSNASKEVVYLKNLLEEIGFPELVSNPIKLYGDNLSAIQLVKNPVYHSRSKHIDIRVHYIREVYEKNIMELKYCSTTEMVADVLTKVLCKQKHMKLAKMLGMFEVQI